MSKWIEDLKSKIVLSVPAAIAGLFLWLLYIAWEGIKPLFPSEVISRLSPMSLLAMLLLSLLIALVSLTLNIIFYKALNKKPRLKNYKFIPQTGFYEHKKTKEWVCNKCLIKGIESPLTVWEPLPNRKWKCILCNHVYPDY